MSGDQPEKRRPPPKPAGGREPDVCLLLEGTYPFVSGGVSSWVHHLVTHLTHLTFAIVHLSPKRGYYDNGVLYDTPENVISLQEVFLHDYAFRSNAQTGKSLEKIERFRSFVETLREGGSDAFPAFLDAVDAEGAGALDAWDLLQTPESWDVLVEAYRREAGDESFLNFFWTWRYAYMPLFNLLAAPVPRCGVYHSISTGYAGLLAAAAKHRHKRPMLLTEHGIYTKERRIEINRSDWIQDWESGEVVAERRNPFFKRYWVRQFEMMSELTYAYSDEIFTLYQGNTIMQMADGADGSKIRVVPNGIDLTRFGEAAERLDARPPNQRFTVGFIGRVCPIKDIKTFVYAMRLVRDEIEDLRVRLMGPWDEDPEYAQDCMDLSELLELTDCIDFEGRVDVLAEMPSLDVLVLTSISEAQPLVVLEGGAVGVPVVATDVGSCEELLFGRTLDDRKFGGGGFITPIATPGATADAVLKLHRDPDLRKELGRNLRSRVNALYDQSDMVGAYADIYGDHLGRKPPEPAEGDAVAAPPAESDDTATFDGTGIAALPTPADADTATLTLDDGFLEDTGEPDVTAIADLFTETRATELIETVDDDAHGTAETVDDPVELDASPTDDSELLSTADDIDEGVA